MLQTPNVPSLRYMMTSDTRTIIFLFSFYFIRVVVGRVYSVRHLLFFVHRQTFVILVEHNKYIKKKKYFDIALKSIQLVVKTVFNIANMMIAFSGFVI